MFLEKVKSEGLAHLSYIIGDGGRAAVIDPRRDCQVYVDIAEREGARITHVFETHRNEDYLVGSATLERLIGAEILHGSALPFKYGQSVSDGFALETGSLRLRVLSTPGHTFESISIALYDMASGDEAVGVFTGDALFVGDVGRTDFFPERSREVAGLLYDSIFGRLLPLGDQAIIYPAHGRGSVCGSNLSKREFSTIGYERKHNAMLQGQTEMRSSTHKVAERHYMPPWFARMHELNFVGAPTLETLPRPAAWSPEEFRSAAAEGVMVLDMRSVESFGAAHIPGSINIPIDMVPSFAGWFLSYDRPISLVIEDQSHIEQAVRYLVRIGYDDIRGWLAGGIHDWAAAGGRIATIPVVSAGEVKRLLERGETFTLLDVRSADEFAKGRLPGALHVYVGELPSRLGEVPRDACIVTFCSTGLRAGIAASILKREGYERVEDCLGSMSACRVAGCPMEVG